MSTNQWIRDRNEAFASKDKEKIIAYCNKYEIEIPENEEVFWAGVHKVICNLYMSYDGITLDSYNESYNWLERHGFKVEIGGEEND